MVNLGLSGGALDRRFSWIQSDCMHQYRAMEMARRKVTGGRSHYIRRGVRHGAAIRRVATYCRGHTAINRSLLMQFTAYDGGVAGINASGL